MIRKFTASFVRPSNGTVYTAGDAVCNAAGAVLTLVPAGTFKEGRIVGAKLSVSIDSVVTPTFQLFLFSDDANIPALTDNAAFAMTAAAEDDLIGYTTFTLELTGTSGGMMTWDSNAGLLIPFEQKIVSGVPQGIYGVLTATDAYNPYSPSTTVDVTVYVEGELE